MKVIYSFMIGLILFNFYACTKQQIEEPLGVYNNIENSKLEFIYLDDKNNATEDITDTILMKLQNDTSGFVMASRKIGENEYATSLIDTNSNSSISMYYKNGESFPYKILLVSEEESIIGYTSIYRKDSEDFDIIWYSDSETGEACKNIPLKNTVYNHVKTSGVAASSDYQVRTIEVSVRIADAINKYVDDNFEDNPITRGFWSKFCNFWKKVFKPIVRVVTIIVAIFIPPVAPIIVATVKIVDKIIDTINGVYIGVEDAAKAASGKKELLIIKESGGRYKDGEELNLKKANGTEKVILDITEAAINNFVGRATMSGNDINPHDKINFYYSFKDDKNNRNYCVSNTSIFLQPKEALNNGSDINLLITRKFNEIGTNNIYLDFIVPDGVFINGKVKPNFRLVLVP